MAASGSAVAVRVIGETSDTGYRGQYEWDWQQEPTKVTQKSCGDDGLGKGLPLVQPESP